MFLLSLYPAEQPQNSWGEYWGEMGFFRVELGSNLLSIEANVAWATPGTWTNQNYPCAEDGGGCRPAVVSTYSDPSLRIDALRGRLHASRQTGVGM